MRQWSLSWATFSWKVEESHNEQIRYAKYQIMITLRESTAMQGYRQKQKGCHSWVAREWMATLSTGMKEGERGPSRGVFRQGKQHMPKPWVERAGVWKGPGACCSQSRVRQGLIMRVGARQVLVCCPLSPAQCFSVKFSRILRTSC